MNEIRLIQNNDAEILFTVTDTDGEAIDLTDAIITFSVKKQKSDDEPVFYIAVDTFADPSTGEVSFEITREMTDITEGTYYWDIMINQNNSVTSMEYGTLLVIPKIFNNQELS